MGILLVLARILHESWEKACKMFFEMPSKLSQGRFLNLSKKVSWIDRKTDCADFSGFHAISGLAFDRSEIDDPDN